MEMLAKEKQEAAEQADKLVDVVERVTEELGRGDFASIAEYAHQLASKIKELADKLRTNSIEDWVDGTRRAARRDPELFLLVSIAAGVALSRFFKASQQHGQDQPGRQASSGRDSEWAEDDDRHLASAPGDTYAAGNPKRD